MVGMWIASKLAAAPAAPLLPDLGARLHPSDSTPWTILFVLTLITLLPAILMPAWANRCFPRACLRCLRSSELHAS